MFFSQKGGVVQQVIACHNVQFPKLLKYFSSMGTQSLNVFDILIHHFYNVGVTVQRQLKDCKEKWYGIRCFQPGYRPV